MSTIELWDTKRIKPRSISNSSNFFSSTEYYSLQNFLPPSIFRVLMHIQGRERGRALTTKSAVKKSLETYGLMTYSLDSCDCVISKQKSQQLAIQNLLPFGTESCVILFSRIFTGSTKILQIDAPKAMSLRPLMSRKY